MITDPDLVAILKLYRRLDALPLIERGETQRRPGPIYDALVAQIRAAVDARTKLRGDEMQMVAELSALHGATLKVWKAAA